MSARVTVGILSFCVAMTGTLLVNIFVFKMIGEINRKRQDGNRISYIGYTFPKMLRILREYRESYPGGKFHTYAFAGFALAIAGLFGTGIALRIIG